MYIAKQGDLIVHVADTEEELQQKVLCMDNIEISEIDEELEFINGKYVTAAEKAQIRYEEIQGLSMTPLDFIKALEKFAGISYEQVKALCDSNPVIDRELRFCQNVYRNNPMFSEEAIAQLPEAFHLTQEQIDQLFVAVNNLKQIY